MGTASTLTDQHKHHLIETLQRLRFARMVGDEDEVRVSERRLNWLIERIPRSSTA